MKLSADFWNTKYKTNKAGWDLGEISPPLKNYIDQLENKELKILIPGGGNSYEAEYLYHRGFKNVFVVDLSEIALQNIKERTPGFPKLQLLQKNFFDVQQNFDLILEQTFFCAIDPKLRSNYAEKMNQILKPNGKLVGVFFDALLNEDHPPFGGNKEEYLTYFKPYFKTIEMEACYNSFHSRDGMELFVKIEKL